MTLFLSVQKFRQQFKTKASLSCSRYQNMQKNYQNCKVAKIVKLKKLATKTCTVIWKQHKS